MDSPAKVENSDDFLERKIAELRTQISNEQQLQEHLKDESKDLRRNIDRMTLKFEEERKSLAATVDDLAEELIVVKRNHQKELLDIQSHSNELKSQTEQLRERANNASAFSRQYQQDLERYVALYN